MTDLGSLPRYLTLAKNVRGLAVYDPDRPPDREFFTWLSRKHQYRNVGFAPYLLDGHPDVDVAGYKTFEAVEFPFDHLEEFADACDPPAPDWAFESLVLASAHATPLFVHAPALTAYEDLSVWELETESGLEADQVLRHMRIAGYASLDFLEGMAGRGREAVLEDAVAAERERRIEVAREDGEERFWRLLEDVEPEDWVGGYADALPAVTPAAREAVDDDEATAVGLGLVGLFAVGPPES